MYRPRLNSGLRRGLGRRSRLIDVPGQKFSGGELETGSESLRPDGQESSLLGSSYS